MMPAAKGMSHMIPNHILRVGQTVCLETAQKTASPHPCLTKPSSNLDDPDFDISLDNLNQLILELDPTFEPIHVPKSPVCISPPTGTVMKTRKLFLSIQTFIAIFYLFLTYEQVQHNTIQHAEVQHSTQPIVYTAQGYVNVLTLFDIFNLK